MKTFQKCLIVLGAFVFAYNADMVVHEAGHALTGIATGGTVSHITVLPFSWSHTQYDNDPEPLASSWGGFLLQAGVGVLAFLTLWTLKSRFSLWALLLGAMCLASAGIYLIVGTIQRGGDPADLIGGGISPIALIVTGSVLILLSLLMTLPAGALLQIGRGHCSYRKTLLVFSPVLLWLLVEVGHSLISNSSQWAWWSASFGGGIALVMLMSGLVHWSAGWICGPEAQRRAAPVNWKTATVSLLLAAGIMAGETIAFPRRPQVSISYFADANNYAGSMSLWNSDPDKVKSDVFWRIDGKPGRQRMDGYVSRVAWSKGLDKFLILASKGIFAMDDSGGLETILEKQMKFPSWTGNDDMTRLIIEGRDPDSEKYFLLAIDIPTGTQAEHESESSAKWIAFLNDQTAEVTQDSPGSIRVTFDASKGWQFEEVEVPPEEVRLLLAVHKGKAVLKKELPTNATGTIYQLEWDDKTAPVVWVWKAISWHEELFIIRGDGAVHRLDSSFVPQEVAPPLESRVIGCGACEAGIWVASRKGKVRISGETEQTVEIDLPSF